MRYNERQWFHSRTTHRLKKVAQKEAKSYKEKGIRYRIVPLKDGYRVDIFTDYHTMMLS